MSWTFNFLIRIALATAVFAVGSLVASRWWDRCGLKSAIAYYVVRIAAMVAAVKALGLVPFDVSGWHLHAGWMVEKGLFPGRDFLTPYHLGFNGLLALCEVMWRSPSSIVVFFTLCEALALRLLYKVADKLLGNKVAKRGIILYLSSPICLMQSTFSAQDETLFTLAIAACLYFTFVADSRAGRSAASIFAVFCTKPIAPFYMVPFLLLRRWKAVAFFGLAFAAYMAAAILLGLHPLNLAFGREPGLAAPADDILGLVTSGNLASLFPMVPDTIWDVALVTLLSVTFLASLRPLCSALDDRVRLSLAIRLMTVWLLAFMLFFRMTYSYYLIPVFPLMCLMVQDEAYLPRRMRPVAVAWTFLFAFKDMLQTGCDYYGFLAGQTWVMSLVSALCAVSTTMLLLGQITIFKGGSQSGAASPL
jgi:hypothetical protein